MDVAAGETGHVEVRLRAIAKPEAPPTPEPVDTARVYENTPGEVDTPAKKLSGSSPSYPSDRAGAPPDARAQRVLRAGAAPSSPSGGEVDGRRPSSSPAGRAVDDVVLEPRSATWKFEPATQRGVRVKVAGASSRQTFLGA